MTLKHFHENYGEMDWIEQQSYGKIEICMFMQN